jgi:F-type H+-transporting ATPase subunit delta
MQALQAASRRALVQAREQLDDDLDRATEADAERLGEELFAAADVLAAHTVLRRHLADPSTAAEDRKRLMRAVLGTRLSPPTVPVLEGLAGSRWSQPRDLLDAVDTLGQLAFLAVAEKDNKLEDVEDELFRVGRLVEREGQLASMLGDLTVPATRRVQLLRGVIAGKVHPVTERLLVRALQAPHALSLDRAAEELAELAAARRERSVAKVSSPVALSEEQQQRLTTALSRIYRRPMSLQVELAPELLGGLLVRVGDEVIDGSIAGRIAAARQHIPH